jgi:molecular chaperone GrpE
MPEHRQRTRAEERAEEIDIRPSKLLADIEGLRAELTAATGQADEYLGALQRERAEFLNYKRRTAEERERDLGLAAEGLIRKVLALADDFDRAIEARPESIATDPWFEGVAAIDHDAIANVPGTDRQEGEIVEQIRRGYRLRDRVLRPALVAVAAGSEPATNDRPN